MSRRACSGRYPSRRTRRSQAPDGRSSRWKAPAESLRAERTAPEGPRRVSRAPATGPPASPSRSRPSRTPASRGGGWVSCRASSRIHKGMKKPALVRERVGAPCVGTSDHLSTEGVVHLGRRQVSWLPVCAFRLLPDPRGISGCCRGRDGGVAVYRSQWRDRGRFSLPSLFFRCPGRAADTCAVMSAGSVGKAAGFVKGYPTKSSSPRWTASWPLDAVRPEIEWQSGGSCPVCATGSISISVPVYRRRNGRMRLRWFSPTERSNNALRDQDEKGGDSPLNWTCSPFTQSKHPC